MRSSFDNLIPSTTLFVVILKQKLVSKMCPSTDNSILLWKVISLNLLSKLLWFCKFGLVKRLLLGLSIIRVKIRPFLKMMIINLLSIFIFVINKLIIAIPQRLLNESTCLLVMTLRYQNLFEFWLVVIIKRRFHDRRSHHINVVALLMLPVL